MAGWEMAGWEVVGLLLMVRWLVWIVVACGLLILGLGVEILRDAVTAE